MLRVSFEADAIPVVDLFAGPGGLGEGFASLVGRDESPVFRLALSIEMDEAAHRTLELRAFHRQFAGRKRPREYARYIGSGRSSRKLHDALLDEFAEEGGAARQEAWHHALRDEAQSAERARVGKALGSADRWVLVGGPPCQAYSLVGRSRRAGDESFAEDEKHTLYKHYLRIIEEFNPPIFVMENVKGLLSARLDGEHTFDLVKHDLSGAGHHGYRILPFVDGPRNHNYRPEEFVIRAECFGVPQARHRVILLGVRGDLNTIEPKRLQPAETRVSVESILGDLPRRRSRLSGRNGERDDSLEAWLSVLDEAAEGLSGWNSEVGEVAINAVLAAREGRPMEKRRRASGPEVRALRDWLSQGGRSKMTLNHDERAHMEDDIKRYLFCASHAWLPKGVSPRLHEFPDFLMPKHENAHDGKFADRFRVQVRDRPASTVASHISKDGHYYIHYDPSQCRSLSVREAARLQTFPDDYFFEGTRTQQYHQVGNAVPPYLARQLAAVVAEALGVRLP